MRLCRHAEGAEEAEAAMKSSFSVVLFVVPLVLCGVVWKVFGAAVGSIAFGIALALMAFNAAQSRPRR